jgi:hypothetical protein
MRHSFVSLDLHAAEYSAACIGCFTIGKPGTRWIGNMSGHRRGWDVDWKISVGNRNPIAKPVSSWRTDYDLPTPIDWNHTQKKKKLWGRVEGDSFIIELYRWTTNVRRCRFNLYVSHNLRGNQQAECKHVRNAWSWWFADITVSRHGSQWNYNLHNPRVKTSPTVSPTRLWYSLQK